MTQAFAHRALAAIALLSLTAAPAAPQASQETFTPEVEASAREVGRSLRCVVCQNQSIEDSGAPLAADMRRMVRERLAAGDSPAEVRKFMTDRYGNFVLLKPPLQIDTLLLWLGPALFLALALAGAWVYLRAAPRSPDLPPPLSDQELQMLKDIEQREPQE